MFTPRLAFCALLLVCCVPTNGLRAAQGPLRIHPDNPRYFTDGAEGRDGSPRALYLTGILGGFTLDVGP